MAAVEPAAVHGAFFSSAAERSQEGEGNVELVHDPRRLVSQSNFTMKLSGKGAE